MYCNEKEVKASGLDSKKIESIARRISKEAMEAAEMGVFIFGGDDANRSDEDGLLRGEF